MIQTISKSGINVWAINNRTNFFLEMRLRIPIANLGQALTKTVPNVST